MSVKEAPMESRYIFRYITVTIAKCLLRLTHWPLGDFNSIFKLILVNGGWGISHDIALRWMPLDFTSDKSTLVQVMAWCRHAASYYLSQCWPRSLSPYGVTGPQWVKQFTMYWCEFPQIFHISVLQYINICQSVYLARNRLTRGIYNGNNTFTHLAPESSKSTGAKTSIFW